METKFKTIEEVKKWVEGLGLHFHNDIVDTLDEGNYKYKPVFFIQSDNDPSVGIFPADFSPAFLDNDAAVRWANENYAILEYVMDVWDSGFFPELTVRRLRGSPLIE